MIVANCFAALRNPLFDRQVTTLFIKGRFPHCLGARDPNFGLLLAKKTRVVRPRG